MELNALLAQPVALPSLPRAVALLMSELAHAEPSLRRLNQLFGTDPALAARLLERFLRAGIDAPPALKTLNSALSLRAESTDSFTTVDLLTLSLQTLEGELYKYGAAPSYLKRGGTVRRVTCSCLPAGLQEGSPPPEATHIKLSPGCFFVMLSDGVADSLDDEWLQNLLAGWEGHDPQQLVAAILADSMEKRGGTDDAGVLALYIPEDSGGAQAV